MLGIMISDVNGRFPTFNVQDLPEKFSQVILLAPLKILLFTNLDVSDSDIKQIYSCFIRYMKQFQSVLARSDTRIEVQVINASTVTQLKHFITESDIIILPCNPTVDELLAAYRTETKEVSDDSVDPS